MKKNHLIPALCALLFALTASADTLRFRSGIILAAELSSSPGTILNLRKDAFLSRPDKPIYAALTVKIDPARKISIFDYSLESFGRVFPCIAIRQKDNFEYTTGVFSGGKIIQLLFELDGRQVGLQKTEQLTLKSNLPPADSTYDLPLDFTLKSDSFTPIFQIPANGTFQPGAKK